MWWDEFYLGCTLLVLLFARLSRSAVALDCAIALLFWTVLVQFAYRYNEVETASTFVIGAVYVVVTLLLIRKYDHHWLTWYLFVSAWAVIFWNAYYNADAYVYKAVKNGIYLGELVAVGVACLTNGRSSGQSPPGSR